MEPILIRCVSAEIHRWVEAHLSTGRNANRTDVSLRPFCRLFSKSKTTSAIVNIDTVVVDTFLTVRQRCSGCPPFRLHAGLTTQKDVVPNATSGSQPSSIGQSETGHNPVPHLIDGGPAVRFGGFANTNLKISKIMR